MTTITKDTEIHYTIGSVKHKITVQKGSTLLLDCNGTPVVDQYHMKKMNALFKTWIKLADEHGVKWVCQGGTLLGAARESKGHLFWDNDIDVNVLYSQYDKLYDLCGIHGEYELEVADSGFNIHPKDAVYPFIDIWVLAKQKCSKNYIMGGPFINRQPTFYANYLWPKEYMYKEEINKRIKVVFEDYEVYVPSNYIEVVKRQFCQDILTNYYYDKTKENHSQLLTDRFISFFTCKNRTIVNNLGHQLCANEYKYIYLSAVNYSNFNGSKQKIIDDLFPNKKYIKNVVIPFTNLLRKLANGHS
jgi:hypothetical protein